jgi:CrcB protein
MSGAELREEIAEDVHDLPVNPDLGETRTPRLHHRAWSVLRDQWDLLLCISAGGALGSVARWGVGEFVPHAVDRFAWSIFIDNVSGAFVLGLLMALVLEVWSTTRYVRPFVGVGLLGGYTTFSTYMLDAHSLLRAGEVPLMLGYLAATLAAGLVAVWAGIIVGRVLIVLATRSTSNTRERRNR